MERINKILNNSKFKTILADLKKIEKDRVFCKHTMEHFISTARICYMLFLEDNVRKNLVEELKSINKDIIYAAGILHDIGRLEQYKSGKDHALVGAEMSKDILIDAGYNTKEIKIITDAIKEHRNLPEKPTYLGEKLYKADKLSRHCYNCSVKNQCHKKDSIKKQPFQY